MTMNHQDTINDEEEERYGAGGKTKRPRKADTESLTYLRSLEPDLDASLDRKNGRDRKGTHKSRDDDEGVGGGDDEEDQEEDQEMMVGNVVEELSNKLASVAMDRHTAIVVEKLCRLSNRHQMAQLLTSLIGYCPCLATNRYSSHVLQTAFSLVGPMIQEELQDVSVGAQEDEDEEVGQGGEDDESRPKRLWRVVVEVAQELVAGWMDLMQDLCGSHVLRALVCVLAGIPVLAEKRGKHSKHQHTVDTAWSLGSSSASLHEAEIQVYMVPSAFSMMLESLVVEMEMVDLLTLHQLIMDTNSGPAINLLVQAIARRDSNTKRTLEESGTMMKLIYKVFCWANEDRSKEVVYAMAGEMVGSRFLEAVIWHGPASFVQAMYRRCMQGQLMEYCEHEVSNFVVQTLLRRVDDRTWHQDIWEELKDHFQELLEQRRGGVIWRLLESCLRLHQEEVAAATAVTRAVSKRAGCNEWDYGAIVQSLVNPKPPSQTPDGRLHLHVPGARITECLLRLLPENSKVHQGLQQALLGLGTEMLEAIAKDNLGSRCLLDPLLERHGGPTSSVADSLASQWKTKLADLACHPVGFHILCKCFDVMSLSGKAQLVGELAASEARLAGTHFGKRMLATCQVTLFRQQRQRWEAGMKKSEKKKDVLEEILNFAAGNEGAGGETGRKGKRPRSKRQEEGKDEETRWAGEKRSRQSDQGGVMMTTSKSTKAQDILKELLAVTRPGEEEEEIPAKVSKTRTKRVAAKEEAATPSDMSFVLQAIKESVKDQGGGKAPVEGKTTSKTSTSRDEGSNTKVKGGRRGGEDKPTSKDQRKAGSKKPRSDVDIKKVLADKRPMMNKRELLGVLANLEEEVRQEGGTKKRKHR